MNTFILLLSTVYATQAIQSTIGDVPTVQLLNKVEMPMVALGTWKYDSATAKNATILALKLGYPHIDTAHNYKNQDGIGEALKGVDRDSYFITSKVPGGCVPVEGCFDYDKTVETNELTLKQLGIDYVDTMLIHFPPKLSPSKSKNLIQQQWKALELMYKQGKAKSIGVSNFCQQDLEYIFEIMTVPPMVNQILYHVGMGPDPQNLVSFCKKHNIAIMAYSPLAIKAGGSKELISGPFTTAMGKKYNKSSVQVSLKYIVQQGFVVLPQSNKESHLVADADIFDWELSEADMQLLHQHATPKGTPSFIHTCTNPESYARID